MERVARYNPAARIIVCLRHPAFRAYSHWRMERLRGNDDLPFADAIREPGRSRVRSAPGGVHRWFSYVERGFYAWQIERVRELFPPEHLLFLSTERLWNEPDAAFEEACTFIGVPAATPPLAAYHVRVDTRGMGEIPAPDRQYLDSLFEDDLRRTARLTALDLAPWLEASYEEPMTAARL